MDKRGRESFIFVILGIIIITLFIVIVSAAPSFHITGTNSTFLEDTNFSYDFTENVTNAGGESLVFEFVNITSNPDYSFSSPSDYYWMSINPSSGIMTINSTRNNETGTFNVSVFVHNPEGEGQSCSFYFFINATNDAPRITNIGNMTINESQNYQYILNGYDEEADIPFNMTINFTSCVPAGFSSRASDNCTLFNLTKYNNTAFEINFLQDRDWVGTYEANITITDYNDTIQPYNASTSYTINITVLNVNDAPIIAYSCDNERTQEEDTSFFCSINATDWDEAKNITFSSNYSWFLTDINSTPTSYNASANISFTPTDLEVGNWSINITTMDSESLISSEIIWFNVTNIEDSPNMSVIENITAYTGNLYTSYVNVTDDDILIPDTSLYDEEIEFSCNESWISVSAATETDNKSIVSLSFTPTALSPAAGEWNINVSAKDNTDKYTSRIFNVTIIGNSAPEWQGLWSVYNATEDSLFSLNVTGNATDSDGDMLNFTNQSTFPSFYINRTTGIINFTGTDEDVGMWKVNLTASDGKTDNKTSINLSIYNVNDGPVLPEVGNITVDEDSNSTFYFYVYDDDFLIPQESKSYYNESLNYSVTIEGPNTSLFTPEYVSLSQNISTYMVNFTPSKTDVGLYNVTLNITDFSGEKNSTSFNITVNEINHLPVIDKIDNQTSGINNSFSLIINSTDIEDGNSNVTGGNTNLTYFYNFLTGTSIFNLTNFNTTTGVIDMTMNDTTRGKYQINVTVNDTEGGENSSIFWLSVYDYPSIKAKTPNSYNLNTAENSSLTFNIVANHSVEDNLTFLWYIDNSTLKENVSGYGDGIHTTSWTYYPNWTEETTSREKNLTLWLMNPKYTYINSWNLTINHTNYPIIFSEDIPNQNIVGDSVTIDLENYFYDVDYLDVLYNESISFSYRQMNSSYSAIPVGYTTISVSQSGWDMTFSSSTAVTEYFEITGNDSVYGAASNNFSVTFTPTSVTTPIVGGGSDVVTRPILLKLIMPGTISLVKGKKIEVPINIMNAGTQTLSGIKLSSYSLFSGEKTQEIESELGIDYISSLSTGKEINTTLTVYSNVDKIGDYDLYINANVSSPRYSDWGKILINLREINQTDVEQVIIFTEELLAENPQCLELKEILNEAEKAYQTRNYELAMEKANEAIEACKATISQPSGFFRDVEGRRTIGFYSLASTLSLFGFGFMYYLIKRITVKYRLKE